MKELKENQIRWGARFDSQFEIDRVIQTELSNRYWLDLGFSVYHQENGRAHLSKDLMEKAKEVALEMQERGLAHPFYSPEALAELVQSDLAKKDPSSL